MHRVVLLRLKYASVFSCLLSEEGLDAIVATSQRSNTAAGITGVMLAYGGIFMQVLEGPPDAVAPLFSRIARDSRHTSVVVLRREDATWRLFGEWSMRLIELTHAARVQIDPARQLIETAALGSASALGRLDEIGRMVWSLGAQGVAARRAS